MTWLLDWVEANEEVGGRVVAIEPSNWDIANAYLQVLLRELLPIVTKELHPRDQC